MKKNYEEIKERVDEVIKEVDLLEIEEKKRELYFKVSKNFNIYTEKDIKDAYDKAND